MSDQQFAAKEAYSKMARLCSRSEQCSADIRKKIIAFELVDEIVEEVLNRLIEEKYIDDRRFVKAYVKDKFKLNKWGKVKIRHYLRQKGLTDTLIQEELDNIDETRYKAVLIKTMKDKARTIKNKTKFEKMGQIIRFAQNRGFEPELIHRYMPDVMD